MSFASGGQTNYGAMDEVQVTIASGGRGGDFSRAEFSTLCDNISSNIYLMQSNASNLERIEKQIGTSSDNIALREKIHQIHQKTNKTVTLTTQYLRQALILARQGEKHHKIQAERLKNEFQAGVQRYSTVQKQLAQKIKSIILAPKPSNVEMISPLTEWSGDDHTKLLDSMAAQQQAQRQLDRELEIEHMAALERDARIQQIESDILNVNDIFRDLASMISDQGERIDTIDSNVTRVVDQVEAGEQQLLQASNYQRKYRRKLFCLLGILFIIGSIIALIIVYTIKK